MGGGGGGGAGGWGGGHFTGGGKGPGSQYWAARKMEKASADMLRANGLRVPITEREIEMRIVLVFCALVVGGAIGWLACLNFGPDDPCPAPTSNTRDEHG